MFDCCIPPIPNWYNELTETNRQNTANQITKDVQTIVGSEVAGRTLTIPDDADGAVIQVLNDEITWSFDAATNGYLTAKYGRIYLHTREEIEKFTIHASQGDEQLFITYYQNFQNH